jgi:uncharacterized protein (TIGR02001 family)
MPRHSLARSLAILAACGAVSTACADASFGGLVDFTTDYIFHGLSQSGGDPAIQADVHYRFSSNAATADNFAGVWGSTTSRESTGATYELNAYAGRTFLLTPNSSATLTFVHYAYPDAHGSPHYDYDELAAKWAYQDRFFVTMAWTPDTAPYSERAFGLCCRVLTYDAAVHQSLGHAFTLSAAVGYDELRGVSGYGYANGGIAYAFGAFQLDVSYFAVQSRAVYLYGHSLAENRWVGTLAWRF